MVTAFDYESASSTDFFILGYAGNPLADSDVHSTAETRVEIVVKDVNDNAPEFGSGLGDKPVVVHWDSEIGSRLILLSATDADQVDKT